MTDLDLFASDAAPFWEPETSDLPPVTRVGSLLAVAGLCGGAGASTLAYLVAGATARSWSTPVLVCDTGGPTAGLAVYARAESPLSFVGTAAAMAGAEPLVDVLFADAGAGVRVIASTPRLHGDADNGGLDALLRDAREAHALTVIDCGTLASAVDVHVLRAASHVTWVLPATAAALERGRRLLDILPTDSSRRELLVARRDPNGGKPPMPALKRLASDRGASLVLMPFLRDIDKGWPDTALKQASVPIEAISAFLRR